LQYVIFEYTGTSLFSILQFEQQNARIQVWRFVSYMLIHSDKVHLYSNMVLQLVLGVTLEIYHGWWRVLIMYLTGGAAGCLGHAMFNQEQTLRGASAGDSALLTAHIASVVIVSI
jgi:membrane associated rhomboid family serine protease